MVPNNTQANTAETAAKPTPRRKNASRAKTSGQQFSIHKATLNAVIGLCAIRRKSIFDYTMPNTIAHYGTAVVMGYAIAVLAYLFTH